MPNFSLKMFAGVESSVFEAIRRTAWRTLCKWHQHSLVHPLKLLVFLLFNFYLFSAHVFASVLLVWRAALQMSSHISVKGLFWFCVFFFHAVMCMHLPIKHRKLTGTCFIYGRRTASYAHFDSLTFLIHHHYFIHHHYRDSMRFACILLPSLLLFKRQKNYATQSLESKLQVIIGV